MNKKTRHNTRTLGRTMSRMMAMLAIILAVSGFGLSDFAYAQVADPASNSQEGLGGILDQILPESEDDTVGLDARVIQLFLIVTVLSLAPGLAMMITCLPFMLIVFSFLRQAMGLQQTPPNMMIMGAGRCS